MSQLFRSSAHVGQLARLHAGLQRSKESPQKAAESATTLPSHLKGTRASNPEQRLPPQTADAFQASPFRETAAPFNFDVSISNPRSWSTAAAPEATAANTATNATPAAEPPTPSPEEIELYKTDHTAGLLNLGNTCYINACYQVFANSPEIISILNAATQPKTPCLKAIVRLMKTMCTEKDEYGEFVPQTDLQEVHMKEDDADVFTADSLQKLPLGNDVSDATESLKRPPSENNVTRQLRAMNDLIKANECKSFTCVTTGAPEDANDLFFALIESIKQPGLAGLFKGIQKEEQTCPKCKTIIAKLEIFSNIAVAYVLQTTESMDLKTLVRANAVSEVIEYTCPTCKNKGPSTKTFTYVQLPRILVLRNIWYYLFEGTVDIPQGRVDASQIFGDKYKGKATYQLFATLNHTPGHWTASCKHPRSKKWFLYDDRHVRELTYPLKPTIQKQFRVMFFRRVDGLQAPLLRADGSVDDYMPGIITKTTTVGELSGPDPAPPENDDVVLYHGSPARYTTLPAGTFFADSRDLAEEFARGETGHVHTLRVAPWRRCLHLVEYEKNINRFPATYIKKLLESRFRKSDKMSLGDRLRANGYDFVSLFRVGHMEYVSLFDSMPTEEEEDM